MCSQDLHLGRTWLLSSIGGQSRTGWNRWPAASTRAGQRSGRLGFSLTRTAVIGALGHLQASDDQPSPAKPGRPVRSRPTAADRLPRLVVEEWLSGWLTALEMTFSQVNGYPSCTWVLPVKPSAQRT